MKYKKIIKGTFINRPNRFVADILLTEGTEKGTIVKAHVKNTGRCAELFIAGATVYAEDFSEAMGTRKLKYSLIGVEKKVKDQGILMVNVDSQAPNKVVLEGLENEKIKLPQMGKITYVKGEKTFGDSRFDFYIEDECGKRGFIEVKGVTLEEDGIARFPDAPTERGVKHVQGLMQCKKEGYAAFVIFVLQMKGMKVFCPNDVTHAAFGDTLRVASKKGVHILAYECNVERDNLELFDRVPVEL